MSDPFLPSLYASRLIASWQLEGPNRVLYTRESLASSQKHYPTLAFADNIFAYGFWIFPSSEWEKSNLLDEGQKDISKMQERGRFSNTLEYFCDHQYTISRNNCNFNILWS